MKTADIVIGQTYLTRIGRELCRVVVVRRRESFRFGNRKQRITFDVRRENEERVLPKPRSAAALRPST